MIKYIHEEPAPEKDSALDLMLDTLVAKYKYSVDTADFSVFSEHMAAIIQDQNDGQVTNQQVANVARALEIDKTALHNALTVQGIIISNKGLNLS